MSLYDDASLWWRTLSPLPVSMHAWRVANDARKALWRPGLPALVALWRQRGQDAARHARTQPLTDLGRVLESAPTPDAKSLLSGRFVLAGRDLGAFPPDAWELPDARPLEVYEAHYLDWAEALTAHALLGDAADIGRLHELLKSWTVESARLSKPWEPYPRARRTLAATRAAARLTLAEQHGRDRWTDSHTAVRDLFLAIAGAAAADLGFFLERHLDGNHLLVDRMAQAVAELAWGSGAGARSALTDEVERQFPGDGAHVEASPMYHALLLEDLLTVRALWPAGADRQRFDHLLQRALGWLAAMTHPDGQLPAFGDTDPAALAGVGLTRTALGSAPRGQPQPQQSAWASRHGGHLAIVHTAPPAWSPQPGHAHADTLSVEWSRADHRILADAGLGGYEGDPQRALNRSEASHSTVEIIGAPQLELWGAFRVGARGRLVRVESGRQDGWDWVGAVHVWPHTAFQHVRLVAHHPTGRLVVADAVYGQPAVGSGISPPAVVPATGLSGLAADSPGTGQSTAVARFLLAPGVTVDATVQLRVGRDRIVVAASRPIEVGAGTRFASRGTTAASSFLQVGVDAAGTWTTFGPISAQEAAERFAGPWATLVAAATLR